MTGNALFRFMSNGDQSRKVIETEGSPIAPCARLVFERPTEGRCEERSVLTDILPDRGFDVAAAQCVSGFFVGSHLVSSFVEMKLALSQEEESQCTFQGGNRGKGRRRRAEEDEAAGVSVEAGANGAPRRC